MMVQFGKTIEQAQRIGWEDAYLDYSSLKRKIKNVESLLWHQDSERVQLLEESDTNEFPPSDAGELSLSDVSELEDLKAEFFQTLQVEIEKVSLFALKMQGQLADAVGAARFDSNELFDKDSPLVQDTCNNLDRYAALSVEMAHLLKFICINAIGIQKILKKYNKIFERIDEPHCYSVENDHLQLLANSQSIMAIHASLQAVLDDCYKRENLSDPDVALDLLRFQCIMECISILKKNASLIHLPFMDFLSKQSMILTGANFGGMDGVGRRALQWLLKLEPQTIRQMNRSQLQRMWQKWSSESEFVSSHLDGGLPYGHRRIPTYVGDEALKAMKDPMAEDPTQAKWAWGGVSGVSMILNLLSILLYTINYYIVAPTANHYAISLGMDGAFGATLIGASSFSALFSAFVYSLWYTQSTFKSALVFSAACPLVGNLVYALAISYTSMPMAIVGRILCGFGSAEVLNRQLISTCVRFDDMTRASALFVAFGASGMSIGPLLAGILDMTAGRDQQVDIELPFTSEGGLIFNDVTAPGFLMALLWLFQLLGLIFLFQEPIRLNSGDRTQHEEIDEQEGKNNSCHNGGPIDDAILKRLEVGRANDEGIYGSFTSLGDSVEPYSVTQCIGPKDLWNEMVSTWGLVFENAGLPVTLLIFSYIEMADEIIISSCSMVVRRYFGWHGSAAGFFIASLGALVLPAHFVVEKASRHISERKILVVS